MEVYSVTEVKAKLQVQPKTVEPEAEKLLMVIDRKKDTDRQILENGDTLLTTDHQETVKIISAFDDPDDWLVTINRHQTETVQFNEDGMVDKITRRQEKMERNFENEKMKKAILAEEQERLERLEAGYEVISLSSGKTSGPPISGKESLYEGISNSHGLNACPSFNNNSNVLSACPSTSATSSLRSWKKPADLPTGYENPGPSRNSSVSSSPERAEETAATTILKKLTFWKNPADLPTGPENPGSSRKSSVTSSPEKTEETPVKTSVTSAIIEKFTSWKTPADLPTVPENRGSSVSSSPERAEETAATTVIEKLTSWKKAADLPTVPENPGSSRMSSVSPSSTEGTSAKTPVTIIEELRSRQRPADPYASRKSSVSRSPEGTAVKTPVRKSSLSRSPEGTAVKTPVTIFEKIQSWGKNEDLPTGPENPGASRKSSVPSSPERTEVLTAVKTSVTSAISEKSKEPSNPASSLRSWKKAADLQSGPVNPGASKPTYSELNFIAESNEEISIPVSHASSQAGSEEYLSSIEDNTDIKSTDNKLVKPQPDLGRPKVREVFHMDVAELIIERDIPYYKK
jgi:hypothetical protein